MNQISICRERDWCTVNHEERRRPVQNRRPRQGGFEFDDENIIQEKRRGGMSVEHSEDGRYRHIHA
jgi:hypothetical protein